MWYLCEACGRAFDGDKHAGSRFGDCTASDGMGFLRKHLLPYHSVPAEQCPFCSSAHRIAAAVKPQSVSTA